MKTSFAMIATALTGLALTLAPKAQAADCHMNTDISGVWVQEGKDGTVFSKVYISQSNCLVRVTDLTGRETRGAVWEFDFSGKDMKSIPEKVVQANAADGAGSAGVESIRSIKYRTKLTKETDFKSTATLQITARMVPQGILKFPISLKGNIEMSIYRQNPTSRANSIYLNVSQLKLVDIEKLPTNISKPAFLMGANFVLDLIGGAQVLKQDAAYFVRTSSLR